MHEYLDVDQQKAVEFTRDERKAYDQVYAEKLEESIRKSQGESPAKKPTGKSQPNTTNHGDI